MKKAIEIVGLINQVKGYQVISFEGEKEGVKYYKVMFEKSGNTYLCNRNQAIKGTVKDTIAIKLEKSLLKAAKLKEKTKLTKTAKDQETFYLNGKTCLSLDQSTTRAGYTLHQDGAILKINSIMPQALNLDYRIHEVVKHVKGIIRENKVGFVSLEGIYLGLNVKVLTDLAKLQGALIALCIEEGVEYTVIDLQRWKSYFKIEGKREEQKKRAILIAKVLTGRELTEDEAESLLMAVYCRRVIQKEEK